MSNAANKVVLPVRVGWVIPGRQLGIQTGSLQDAGWSTVECVDAEHARQIMTAYPSAAVPSWRNPRAAWNR